MCIDKDPDDFFEEGQLPIGGYDPFNIDDAGGEGGFGFGGKNAMDFSNGKKFWGMLEFL